MSSRYSQWRSLSSHVERIFSHKNWRGRYWQHSVSKERRYVPHSRSFTQCFETCFWRSDYQPQSWCGLATSGLRFDTVGLLFGGVVKDKCYIDKPETMEALKDNIRKTIDEIQLHTIEMCLKIGSIVWLLHGQLRQPFECNYFPLLIGNIVLLNEKKKFEKIFRSFFLKHFQKKNVF